MSITLKELRKWIPCVSASRGDFRGKYYSTKYLRGDAAKDYDGLVVYRCILGCNMKNAITIDCEVLTDEEDSLSSKTLKYFLDTIRVLKGASFNRVTFDAVRDMPDFSESKSTNCVFQNVTWSNGSWENVNFEGSTFIDCEFQGLYALGCNLSHCKFIRCSWEYYEPSGEFAELRKCDIENCDFSHSSFEDCSYDGLGDVVMYKDQYEDVTVVSGRPLVSERYKFY